MSFSADRGNIGDNIFVIASSVQSQPYTTHGYLCQMSFSADRGNIGDNIFVIASSVSSQPYTTHGYLCQMSFSADRGNIGGNIFVIISSARNRSECASVARSSTTVPAIARYGTTGVCCSCKVRYYCTSNCKVWY